MILPVDVLSMRSESQTVFTGNTLDWGVTDYSEALERQFSYVAEIRAGRQNDALIFTEHHPVYTLGVRRSAASSILKRVPQPAQQASAIPVIVSNRGGDATYHGPGQIVGYPILSLEARKDLRAYLHDLEEVLIQTLKGLDLYAHRREGKTGVWIGQRKIAAIGIAVRAWVAYHGFALNVNNDLTPFKGIVPCGIPTAEGTVTSVAAELGQPFDLESLKKSIAIEFWKKFSHPHPRL